MALVGYFRARTRVNEFELIRHFFTRQSLQRADVAVGIGDDAAVLEVAADQQLVTSTDTLNAGIHFPLDTEASAIGHKCLAVNLSDLAAMGATPAWFTLNLSLPQVDPTWIEAFCQGMFTLADEYGVQLVGGDTTRGPLTITVTAQGLVPRGQALLRRGARAGDLVYVTGQLGDAGVGLLQHAGTLQLPEAERAQVLRRLHLPTPRVREGQALRGMATSCIDVSDGLAADLGHVLAASGVGARLDLACIPLSAAYRRCLPQLGWEVALTHGDDYELCFTLPVAQQGALQQVAARFSCGFTRIGEIQAQPGLRLVDGAGKEVQTRTAGYDHFRVSK